MICRPMLGFIPIYQKTGINSSPLKLAIQAFPSVEQAFYACSDEIIDLHSSTPTKPDRGDVEYDNDCQKT